MHILARWCRGRSQCRLPSIEGTHDIDNGRAVKIGTEPLRLPASHELGLLHNV